MAWPATNIPNRSPGEFIDDPDWDELVDALNALANLPMCRAVRTATQTITHNTETPIGFTAADAYDTAGIHDPASNPTRLTVPAAWPGVWHMGAFVGFNADPDTDTRLGRFRKNGTTVVGHLLQANNLTEGVVISGSFEDKFVAGDYVELIVYHFTGEDLVVSTAAMWARWVGRG